MIPTESQTASILENLCSRMTESEECNHNCRKCPVNFVSDTRIEEFRTLFSRIVIASQDRNIPSCLFCETQNDCTKKQEAIHLMKHHKLNSDVLTYIAEGCEEYKRINDNLFLTTIG